MNLNDTPRANRLHIGIFGKRNSGKSSLINMITGQDIAVVSDIAGTTTDPVYKAMEINGVGAVVLIDTAGFDDEGELGLKRIEKTEIALQKTDIAVMLFAGMPDIEEAWCKKLKNSNTPIIPVINKSDILADVDEIYHAVQALTGEAPMIISALENKGREQITERLIRVLPENYKSVSLIGNLVKSGEIVLLVMPQDLQAPKGRLILPQVQTIRELLDKSCIVLSCTADMLQNTLNAVSAPPKLIITDSQIFKKVYEIKPDSSLLTSFSVLMAASKGDIEEFVKGAQAISALTEASHILIAEACTHAPFSEDIGRIKIPRMLREKIGTGLSIDFVSGTDFPENLSGYDLIIHCGACMFNRKYVLSRISKAVSANVPITNYGITIAFLNGILDKISY